MAQVQVPGTPASATGQMGLRDAAMGSELRVRTAVSVAVPLFGGRIEESIGEQILKLLDLETTFMLDWLTRNG